MTTKQDIGDIIERLESRAKSLGNNPNMLTYYSSADRYLDNEAISLLRSLADERECYKTALNVYRRASDNNYRDCQRCAHFGHDYETCRIHGCLAVYSALPVEPFSPPPQGEEAHEL